MTTTDPPLPLGTKTPWGRVAAIIFRAADAERYYMMVRDGGVALHPACVVEPAVKPPLSAQFHKAARMKAELHNPQPHVYLCDGCLAERLRRA